MGLLSPKSRVRIPYAVPLFFLLLRRYPDSRGLRPGKEGILCANDTPEGENIGLLENTAIFAHIRIGVENSAVVPMVQNLRDETNTPIVFAWDPTNDTSDPTMDPDRPASRTYVFVNGDPIGYTDNVYAAARAARVARRNRWIPYDASIWINNLCIIFCT